MNWEIYIFQEKEELLHIAHWNIVIIANICFSDEISLKTFPRHQKMTYRILEESSVTIKLVMRGYLNIT